SAAAAFDSYVTCQWERHIESARCAMGLSRHCALRHRRLGLRAISPTSVERGAAVAASPDDHFTACPYRCVIFACDGCIDEAGGHPTIHPRIVSSPGIQFV